MTTSIVLRIATPGILLIALCLPAQAADLCDEWKRNYAAYENEISAVIQDEPEDLPKELRRYARALARGYTDQAEQIETKIREGLTGLGEIDPHPDVRRFHTELTNCYRNGVAVLDADRSGDGPGRLVAEVRTWQAFRQMFVTVRDLLEAHGCDSGEAEVIDQKYLVRIDAEIEALRARAGRSQSP
jgi:hypothetical protein